MRDVEGANCELRPQRRASGELRTTEESSNRLPTRLSGS